MHRTLRTWTGPEEQLEPRTAQTPTIALGPDPAREHPPWDCSRIRRKETLHWDHQPGRHDPGAGGAMASVAVGPWGAGCELCLLRAMRDEAGSVCDRDL